MAAAAVDAQLLGAFGDGRVVLLQVVFGIASGVEAGQAFCRAMYCTPLPMPMATRVMTKIGHDSQAR